jgi:hypothetical protein
MPIRAGECPENWQPTKGQWDLRMLGSSTGNLDELQQIRQNVLAAKDEGTLLLVQSGV